MPWPPLSWAPDKPIMKWFMPFGKYVFVPLCIACFVLGIWWGGIG